MNKYTAIEVQEMINELNLSLELEKVKKQWHIDGQQFNNLSQVVSYIKKLTSKKIEKGELQGEDGVHLDRSKVMILQFAIKAPIPSGVKDSEATNRLHQDGEIGDVVKNQLRIERVLAKNGKVTYQLPEELRRVQSVRQKLEAELKSYALPYSINANRVVSVHFVDKINTIVNKYRDELEKLTIAIQAKLDEWREISIDMGLYVDGKFPSASYFEGYTIAWDFLCLGESFNFEDEVKRNAFSGMRETLSEFLSAVQGFLNGDAKQFKNSNLQNFVQEIENLRQAGLVTGAKVDAFLKSAEEKISSINPVAIREAKRKIEKGVVAPRVGGRGKPRKEVKQHEIDECEKFIQKQKQTLAELHSELEGII